MQYTLTQDFIDNNNIPVLENTYRFLPYYKETHSEVFIVNDLVNETEPVVLRKLNFITGNFDIIFNDIVKDGNDYIIGIADIVRIKAWYTASVNDGFCGYITVAYIKNSSDINYAIYFSDDITNPFKIKLYRSVLNISLVKAFESSSNGVVFYQISADNTQVNWIHFDNFYNFCKYYNINPQIDGNETKSFNSNTYYRFINTTHEFLGYFYDTNRQRNSSNLFITNDKKKLAIEYKTADSSNWHTISIWDGDLLSPAKTYEDLTDKVNANWQLFGPFMQTPPPSYSPFYVYIPVIADADSTASTIKKTGIYSITSSQNDTRQWSKYLLYSDEYPNGILGGTYYNNKLYIVYRNSGNVFIYSQSGYWIDDQETNNTGTPFYKEVLFNPNNFDLVAGPISVSSNVVLGGITFYGNKINLLLNEV